MQRVSSRSCKRSQLTPSLPNLLNAYTVAAGTAAVLSITPADAEVIFTPANGHIAENQVLSLDINHDGVPDFALFNIPHVGPNSHSFGESFSLRPAPGNGAWVSNNLSYLAAALPAGVSVGSKAPFHSQQLLMAFAERTDIGYFSGGAWKSATNRFLGLKFRINGEVHYGWARLTVLADKYEGSVKATLTGYAYETVANKPILTGQISGTAQDTLDRPPAGHTALRLGLLALGSSGLSAWRCGEDL